MSKNKLSKIRNKIDKIDSDIIDLLKKRIDLVKEVGSLKKQENLNLSFIRSGREAQMIRDLTEKIDGSFPKAAIANIWRMIISTSLYTEQQFDILSYTNQDDDSCYWLAREYYGDFVNIICLNSADEIIDNVTNSSSNVGILPLIDDNDKPWWVRPKGETNNIYVFARIPFIEKSESFVNPALAVANIMPEKTDDDVSIFAVHSDDSPELIERSFKKLGLNPKFLANSKKNYLVEVEEFIDSKSDILNDLYNHFQDNNWIRLLGSYAAPITNI